jgi:hypothetical protein
LSIYAPDSPFKVFEQPYFHSDGWDQLESGQDFDFSRPFFPQFRELMEQAPLPALANDFLSSENSNFCNFTGYLKNCYLIFHADFNRDCFYGFGIKNCESVVDGWNNFGGQFCYECVDCHNGYELKFSQDCFNCSDSWFLKNSILASKKMTFRL